MTSDLESLLDNSQPFTRARRPIRAHPRLTGYRILFFLLTAGFGAIKAFFSYKGQTTSPTTLDWVYGVVVVSALYWLGLYEEECAGKLPRWIFETDAVDVVKEVASQARAQYRYMNLKLLLRKMIGYPVHKPGDPEQHLQSTDLSLNRVQPGETLESNVREATGVQLNAHSDGINITHRWGGGRARTWTNNQAAARVKCDYCNRTFGSDDALHNHCVKKADHPYCESCETIFDDEQALKQHTRDAAVHQDFERKVNKSKKNNRPCCNSCDLYFGTEQALQQHTRDAPAHRFCEPCRRQFTDWEDICKHLAASNHHEWCFACWEDFSSHEKLRRHCASVHVRKSQPTECPLCDEGFGDPIDIGPHIERGCA
ncbi:hypothetical protein C8R44DRAFT_763235 [Mycena epipterygia]|nr:hypothetical protein C8R44DRAFT_763235 [Mycena epipterygia]